MNIVQLLALAGSGAPLSTSADAAGVGTGASIKNAEGGFIAVLDQLFESLQPVAETAEGGDGAGLTEDELEAIEEALAVLIDRLIEKLESTPSGEAEEARRSWLALTWMELRENGMVPESTTQEDIQEALMTALVTAREYLRDNSQTTFQIEAADNIEGTDLDSILEWTSQLIVNKLAAQQTRLTSEAAADTLVEASPDSVETATVEPVEDTDQTDKMSLSQALTSVLVSKKVSQEGKEEWISLARAMGLLQALDVSLQKATTDTVVEPEALETALKVDSEVVAATGSILSGPVLEESSEAGQTDTPVLAETWRSYSEKTTLDKLGETTLRTIRYMSAKDESKMTVRLVPPTLGEIQIEVTHTQESMKVRMATGSAAVREMLEVQLPQLKQALDQQGISLVGISVAADMSNGRQSADTRSQKPRDEEITSVTKVQASSGIAKEQVSIASGLTMMATEGALNVLA